MVELTEAGLEARKKYMREWQRKNREKKRDMENRRWNKIGEQMEAEEAAKRKENQEGANAGGASNE